VANPSSRVRGAGSPARRTMSAAARAAAKRAGRPARPEQHGALGAEDPGDEAPRAEEQRSGRTLLIEAPPNGWQDPPEPLQESVEERPEEGTRWSGPRLLTVALCVLLVTGLVAATVLGWQYREKRRAERAREEALAAAQKAAPVVLSYDYRHLDRDFARARACLTGAFRDQYLKTTKTVVGPTATKYHGVVKATVAAPTGGGAPAASVVSAAPDRVVVLLFVNQVTRSTQVSGSRLDLNRVRMTLTRTPEGWKVSAVDAL
jgi:Mce-associated membrane protein